MSKLSLVRALRSASVACLAWWVAATSAHAHTTPLAVEVIELSGGEAYLSSGNARGLRVGTTVRFGRKQRRVLRANRLYAVVSAAGLRLGSRGTALIAPASPSDKRLPEPRALSAFAGQWPVTASPAALQHPKRVRISTLTAARSKNDASLSTSAVGFVPLRDGDPAAGRADLRARIRVSSDSRVPVEFRGDVAVQTWFGRYATGIATGDARPMLQARELALSLGAADDYRAHLGRLRYAAANLGPLDGARLEAARLGPVRLAGFGGLLPDPISGGIDSNTGRFGLELDVRSERDGSLPELTLVAHGSVFRGRMDERRLFASTQLWPGDHRLQAYAEAALFDRDNPWGRPSVDLSAAGADMDLRFGAVRLNARVDMRKPERSYWLAHSLPASWLCSTASVQAVTACAQSDDTRYLAQALVGWTGQDLAAQLDGAWMSSSDPALGRNAMLHALVRSARPLGPIDFGLGGSFETGNLLLTNLGLRANAGINVAEDRLRLTAYYRPARRFYTASLGARWEHGAGVGVHVSPTPALSLDLLGDARLGDANVLLGMLFVNYRFLR